MCLTNIKYIGHIYYPRNWEFYNKTNYILDENKPTKEINLNVVFQRFQKIQLYHYAKSCETHLGSCAHSSFFLFFCSFLVVKSGGKNEKEHLIKSQQYAKIIMMYYVRGLFLILCLRPVKL